MRYSLWPRDMASETLPGGRPPKAVPPGPSYASVTRGNVAGVPPVVATPAVAAGLVPNTTAGRPLKVMLPPANGLAASAMVTTPPDCVATRPLSTS